MKITPAIKTVAETAKCRIAPPIGGGLLPLLAAVAMPVFHASRNFPTVAPHASQDANNDGSMSRG
jgi:hypothetical protein